jgi:site-specific recombinase XerD
VVDLQSLFSQFCKEKLYIQNVSQHTLEFYKYSFKAFNLTEPITKSQLNERVTALREAGKSAGCVDAYTRGINPFLTWLHENDHLQERLMVKRAKLEQRAYKPLTDSELKAIVHYKPKNKYEWRVHVLILAAIDTGARINELLTLERSKLNLDDLLLTVRGKGNKERTIPFSIELRKHLFKYLRSHNHQLVFCTRHGGKLLYDNMRRNFSVVMKNLGIEPEGAFHLFRRTFARNFVRNGGGELYLQKFLGHTTLKMTRRYVELDTDDLQAVHSLASPLSRIR